MSKRPTDKERLDFLGEDCGASITPVCDGSWNFVGADGHCVSEHPNIREAIDAAMRAGGVGK